MVNDHGVQKVSYQTTSFSKKHCYCPKGKAKWTWLLIESNSHQMMRWTDCSEYKSYPSQFLFGWLKTVAFVDIFVKLMYFLSRCHQDFEWWGKTVFLCHNYKAKPSAAKSFQVLHSFVGFLSSFIPPSTLLLCRTFLTRLLNFSPLIDDCQ